MEPPASPPLQSGTSRAASAAPEPPLDPPDVRVVSHGLKHGPEIVLSVVPFQPKSGVFVLPTMMAPLARMRSVTMSSFFGTLSPNSREPKVVRMPFVALRSLTPKGTPCSGPSSSPAMTAASARCASAIACSGTVVMNARSSPSYFAMRSRKCAVTSTGETCRSRMSAANSEAVNSVRSAPAMLLTAPPRNE